MDLEECCSTLGTGLFYLTKTEPKTLYYLK